MHVSIETRLPSSGEPVRLSAGNPTATWSATDAAGLLALLPTAMTRLHQTPDGLLAGLLPYPAANRTADDTDATPPTLLLFDRHDVQSSDAGSIHDRDRRRHGRLLHDDVGFALAKPFVADTTPADYMAGVRRIQDYLTAGDVYQVNLAQRFTAAYRGDPRLAFEQLRARFNPPHAAYIDLGDRQILSFSPESFLEATGDQVVTRPIKGTRPRHSDPAEDARLAADLAVHPKDRAENLMIVDLLRNDLGRVCVPGSIEVPSLFAVESFHNVHHLVSTVTGRLRRECGIPALLAACFPGGSITGTPKKRAMEIINELEPHARDVYCGSIFWMTRNGHFGSNIAIRTFVAHAGILHGWAGAGIIADSDPAREQQECLDKLAPLMRSMEESFLQIAPTT